MGVLFSLPVAGCRLVGDFDSLVRPPGFDIADAGLENGLPAESCDCRRLLLIGVLEVGEGIFELDAGLRNIFRVPGCGGVG